MHSFLIETIEDIVSLDVKDKTFIQSIFKEFIIKKGDFFLKEGEVNKRLGFIQKGLVCIYINKNGENVVIDFAKEGEFVTVYESFLRKGISAQTIQAIEDTTFLNIDNEGLQRLYNNLKNGNRLGRAIIERRYIELARQLHSLYLHNSEQRYLNFVESYPDLVNRIPQYYISSFVGVKPQSLSRIRKRLSKK
jgi:CRP-like cAMP-binding protein